MTFCDHRFEPVEPPEWMLDEAAGWDQEQWDDYYDIAQRRCARCGQEDN